MLITTEIFIKVNGNLVKYYQNLGYNVPHKHVNICVKIEHLSHSSNKKVLVKCDYCGNEKEITYARYNKNIKYGKVKYSCSIKCSLEKMKMTTFDKYGVEYVSQLEEVKNKKIETCLLNNGVSYPTQSKEIMEKQKKTNIIKYGVEYSFLNEDVKKKSLKTLFDNYGVDQNLKSEEIRGNIYYKWINNNHRVFNSGFIIYKKIVKSITNKIRDELFEKWDGYDYYDGEYIKNNSQDKNYPTIDHKISTMNGYINKIPPEIIGRIDNLCITKLYINSSKGSKNFDNFRL